MSLKIWLKGLGVFVLSSIITSLAAMNLSPSTFNFTRAGLEKLGVLLAIVGGKAVLLYLRQSPLQPSEPSSVASIRPGAGGLAAIACMLLMSALAHGQTPAPSPTPAPAPASATASLPSNVYAGGLSDNSGGSPEIAGTGLYAHLLSDGSTYTFALIDAVPTTVKPLTVNTDVGVGVAQKVATIGKIPILTPVSASFSYNGTNAGWAYSGGACGYVKLKGNWAVMPCGRFEKSSIGNGTGYRPLVSLLIAWGH